MRMDLLNLVLSLLTKVVLAGGGIWLIFGVIVLAAGLKNHEGPAIQSGIWQILGGGMIIAASAWFQSAVTGW
jgi:hypothetical protein